MTYAINFRIVIKPKQTFNYNFKLYNIYFINNKRKPVSTSSRKKRKLNKQLVLLSYINKIN